MRPLSVWRMMDRVFQKDREKSLSHLRVWMIVVPVPRVVMVWAYQSCLELRFVFNGRMSVDESPTFGRGAIYHEVAEKANPSVKY